MGETEQPIDTPRARPEPSRTTCPGQGRNFLFWTWGFSIGNFTGFFIGLVAGVVLLGWWLRMGS